MPVETPVYVADLVPANPVSSDQRSQGDDHIRNMKTALQNTFPGANRAWRMPASSPSTAAGITVSEATDLEKLLIVDATAASRTVALPATAIDGWQCQVIKIDSSANPVILDPASTTQINGALTYSLTLQYQLVTARWCQSLGQWLVFPGFPRTPYFAGAQDIPFSDIAPSANAKRLLGAATATDFSEQTIATVLEWLNAGFARGDLLMRGVSAFDRFAPGATGTFLQSNGAGADLIWGLPLVPAFVSASYATNAALAGNIPYDDTIPQVGEGTEILSLSITAIKATSKIRLTFQGFGGVASSGPLTAALYIDGGANAVQATVIQTAAINTAYLGALEYVYTPGDTSAHTISVRTGPPAGGHFWNGTSTAARRFGGAAAATLIAQEIFTA